MHVPCVLQGLGSEAEVCSSGEDADMDDIPLQVSDRSTTPVSCGDNEERNFSPRSDHLLLINIVLFVSRVLSRGNISIQIFLWHTQNKY